MTALHSSEILLAEGSFRVLLTPNRRLVATIDIPHSSLGPLHLVFGIDRGIQSYGLPPNSMQVGGIFEDIGKFAEGAFHEVSKAIVTVARPVFDVAKGAVSQVMTGIAKATPFLPPNVRNDISSAARIVARARLGDVTAKQFLQNIAHTAKAGIEGARKVGDMLLDGARLVSRIVDVPLHLLGNIPGLGDVVKSISPFRQFDKITGALQKGDIKQVGEILKGDLRLLGSALSMIPGVGSGINAGLSAGLAALDGGRPLDIAVKAAYGAIPIPPGLNMITDGVVDGVLALARSGNINDAAIAAAKGAIPKGFPQDIFDTLLRVVLKQVPRRTGPALPHFDPKTLAEMSRIALPIGVSQRPAPKQPALPNAVKILPIFRQIAVSGEGAEYAVGGEEPIAYAVAGEVFVGGEEPIAVGAEEVEVGGEDPIAYAVAGETIAGAEGVEVGGEDPIAYAVAGESLVGADDGGHETLTVGAELTPAFLASLSNESQWLSTRTHAASGR